MTIKIRPYRDSDYAMVADWWRAWRWKVLTPEYLPPIGAIVSVDGVDTCAAWLYRTDSRFALIEWFISNPKARQHRKEAVTELAAYLCGIAKGQGFKSVIVMVKNQHLIRTLRECGFVGEQDGMTNMIRRVDNA